MSIKCLLSTTILPLDGTYSVESVVTLPSVVGVPHFINHPATTSIVESLGSVKSGSNLFEGLQPGESALCCAIKQGRSTRKDIGKTVDQEVTVEDLHFRILTRIS